MEGVMKYIVSCKWAESYAFLLPSLLCALCWLAYRGGAL
jgi:hypothetical protein